MSKEAKLQLVEFGKKISKAGLVIGSGGNISLKVGEIAYMKAKGVYLGEAKASDFVAMGIKEGKPTKKGLLPTLEFKLHLACFRARKDIGAVIHAHPPLAVALAERLRILKAKYYELLANVGTDVVVLKRMKAGSEELASAVFEAIKTHNALLLKGHGIVCVGKTLKEAYLRAVALERAALTELLVRCFFEGGRRKH